MAREQPLFLPRRIAHWRRAVTSAQPFILADGPDQNLPGATGGCRIIRLPRLAPACGRKASRRLLHLRAMDAGILQDRHALRRRHVTNAKGQVIRGVAGAPSADDRDSADQSLAAFADPDPVPLDRDCDSVRRRIARTWTKCEASGIWSHDHVVSLRRGRSYDIPDRCPGLV